MSDPKWAPGLGWSTTFDPRDLQDLAALVTDLDHANPSAGFASLTDAEVTANAGVLQLVLDQRANCAAHCPGARACRTNPALPRWHVVSRVALDVNTAGDVRVQLAYDLCAKAKAVVATDPAYVQHSRYASLLTEQRRRREEEQHGSTNTDDHIPF